MPLQRRVCDVSPALVRVDGNSSLLREMLDLFRQDSPEFQQRLRNANAASEGAAIQKATHGLRGMLAYFSAVLALEIAGRNEQMPCPCNQVGALAAALEFDAEFDGFVRVIESELPR